MGVRIRGFCRLVRSRLPALTAAAAVGMGTLAGHGAAPAETGTSLDPAAVHGAQPGLLAEALGDIRPGVEGEVELFAVLAAYYPNEGVFLREVEAIGPLLEERFGAEGRIVTLANSAAHPQRFPMANPMNLSAAIGAVREKMNLGEDVLLIYLTSHGIAGALSAGEWAVGTRPLLADELDRLLDRAAVPNLAMVIGACRSGSFVPHIAAPDRLIVTAAAADRSSFGCSDERHWTYFGEAFFARGLAETRSLPQAFARAAALVRQWEAAEEFVPSEPQIAMGEEIGEALEALAEDAAR